MIKLITHYRFLVLFIILLAFCFFKAVNDQHGVFYDTDVVFAMLIAATLVIIGNKHNLFSSLVILFALTELIFLTLRHFGYEASIETLNLFCVIIFLIVMASFCLYFTLQDKTISVTTLFGSLSVYLLIGLVFAYIFLFIERLSPMSFSGLQTEKETLAIYFSFITLNTVGFGDISPLKPISQTFVWMEAFLGQGYLALIIGQLIGRYVSDTMKIRK